MQVGVAVGGGDVGIVDLVQPVVRGDLAGYVEDQPAEGIALVGVGAHPPILAGKVFVHRRGDVHQGLALAAQPAVAFAVDHVGARRGVVAGLHQHPFDQVLDPFDIQAGAFRQAFHHAFGERLRLLRVELAGGLAGGGDGAFDLAGIEGDFTSVALEQGGRPGSLPGLGHLISPQHDVF